MVALRAEVIADRGIRRAGAVKDALGVEPFVAPLFGEGTAVPVPVTVPEVRILRGPGVARIAVRLIHALIESEPLTAPYEFVGPDGEMLDVIPIQQGRQLRVSVRQ